MIALALFVWLLWCALVAGLTQAAIMRIVKPAAKADRLRASFVGWGAGISATVAFISWSGFSFTSVNHEDPWQWAAMLLLLFAPFGLPALVGLPLVALYKVWISGRKT